MIGRCEPAIVAVLAQFLDHAIVEQQERSLQSGDHQVLIVARVRDNRSPVSPAGHVLELPPVLHVELGPLAES